MIIRYSPNAEEAFSLLSIPLPDSDIEFKNAVEDAAKQFLGFSIGKDGSGCVIIRCGDHGSYISTRERRKWIHAYWTNEPSKVIDVTGKDYLHIVF